MTTKISFRDIGDVTIIDVSGRITFDGGTFTLRDLVSNLCNKGKKKIILNLYETMYVDSSGIDVLVCGFTSLANKGTQLKLLSVKGSTVIDLLHKTKLDTVFKIFDDEKKAIESFND